MIAEEYATNPSAPSELIIFNKISLGKFSIFAAYSPYTQEKYALKIFPEEKQHLNPYFVRETHFMQFSHPNIISIVDYKAHQIIPFQDGCIKVPYTVMELAPYGDFFNIIMDYKIKFDEILTRTYFHQLIEAIEYMHSKGASHLDLKLENLLLGSDFQLKVTDFDSAYIQGDPKVSARGTKSYRAPEILKQLCEKPEAADVYSAGVVLFIFKSGGALPYQEQMKCQGFDFFDLMTHNKPLFWEKHREIQRRSSSFFSEDFKALFERMIDEDPDKRASIDEIKAMKWYNGPTLSHEELQYVMSQRLIK